MSSQENKFVWTDAYALGYPQMDDTHHEFVDTVNAMLMAQDSEFAQALDAFADHAQRHFDQEAEWMNSSGFPAAGCHIDEHNAVMKSVRDVQELIKSGTDNSIQIGRGLADELVRWFPGHADYLDSALSHWMSKRAFGGKPVVVRRNLNHTEHASETSD
jgi:hemerythrin